MTALGALLGLALAIVLIIKKHNPAYSLILGALAGGLCGGGGLAKTVVMMLDGVRDICPAVVRILTAGVLSGALVRTGAAARIATALVRRLGGGNTLFALALAAMLLTATGVFIDVAVITIAPVALAVGRAAGLSKVRLLLALVGGGKCGNIISPNPNTIVAAENMGAPLSSVMLANLAPALLGLAVVVLLVRFVPLKGAPVADADTAGDDSGAAAGDAPPSLAGSLAGPLAAIGLLALRPLCGVTVDPLVALPAGGLAALLCTGRWRRTRDALAYGLEKMSVVAVLLIGTGAIAGVIKSSVLKDWLLRGLDSAGLGEVLIAPVSGALMSAATASTTAGAAVASSSFSAAIIAAGVSAAGGAAMINAGATVLDHLPHGSFFHATAGAMQVDLKERMKLMPLETLVGAFLAFFSTVFCLLWNC